MPSLLPFLSLASFAIASASADTLIWSKVVTTKPSSTSPLVWSNVETAKPTSTSPLVWSKVETSKSSSSSSVPSTSPLVWSKVVTSRPTITSTPVWSRVITTRTPTSTTLVPSNTSSPSTTRCSIDILPSTLPTCLAGSSLEWSKVKGYKNYEGDKTDSAMEISSGFLSGRPCPNFNIRQAPEGIMLLSVSDEFAEMHGGFENICGKEMRLTRGKVTSFSWFIWGGAAVIAHSCSEEYCPGSSFGVGGLYNHALPLGLPFNKQAYGIQLLELPDKQHEAKDYQWSWSNI